MAEVFVDPQDGQHYRILRMRDKRKWFAENYRLDCPGSLAAPTEINPSEPGYAPHYNAAKYGRLYQFSTAVQRAPIGWRLPMLHDWKDLLNAYGCTLHTDVPMGNESPEPVIRRLNEDGFDVIRGISAQSGQYASIGTANRASFWCTGSNIARILRKTQKTDLAAKVHHAIFLTVAGEESRAYAWVEPTTYMYSVRYVQD